MDNRRRHSLRKKVSSRRDQASPTPVTQSVKRPRRKCADISYAESSSSESATENVPSRTLDVKDANDRFRTNHPSQANLPGSQIGDAASAGTSRQIFDELPTRYESTQTHNGASDIGSAHTDIKNKRRSRHQGLSEHGEFILTTISEYSTPSLAYTLLCYV